MKGIIDTSSLLALTRYYLPFDKSNRLKGEIQRLFDSGQIVVLDKVIGESKYIAGGIIPQGLPFIFNQPKKTINTATVLPNPAFFSELETNYCNQNIRNSRGVTPAGFEIEKRKYLNGADAKQILYAITVQGSGPVIVTEESAIENDGKLFKKIPSICSLAGINCCTMPSFLKNHCAFDLGHLLS
jgi:hypothetical protein